MWKIPATDGGISARMERVISKPTRCKLGNIKKPEEMRRTKNGKRVQVEGWGKRRIRG